jgi:hypothetical protein
MKPFNMLKMPMILLGFGGALLLSPTCKAQECSPDHFTDTGVEDVYAPAALKVVTTTAKPKPSAVQARKHPTGSAATLQLAANRDSSELPQPSEQAVAEKRKPAPKP